MEPVRIAVIGAGLSGLICARALAAAGLEVRVFDKGRGVSGRMSLRRIPGNSAHPDLQFDHGAQYFTARSSAFREQVQDWITRGVVSPWEGPFVTLTRGQCGPDPGNGDVRYVGVPGMNAICKDLSLGLDVQCGVRVTGLSRGGGHWRVAAERVQTARELVLEEEFAAIVCTLPAPQAVELLPEGICFREELSAVQLGPCWCGMVSFAQDIPVAFSAGFVQESPLRWIARERSKPGRPRAPDNWVLHASPDWSRQMLSRSPEQIASALLAAFSAALGRPLPEPIQYSQHRWMYALPVSPLAAGCLVDPGLGLIACGDWSAGDRVEGAFQAGQAAAEAVRGLFLGG
ncbi:MAG: NAD(P)-binding protein [Planctomycetaceae bacterium]|nr:NAD(P)-binding protein [Planctomycetaceae bacterium]